MQFHFIDWRKFHEMAFQLSQTIVGNGRDRSLRPEIIIAISRGGLVLARILSDFLKLPIYNIAIESYSEIGKNKTPVITQDLGSADICGKKILLVDEICDSGKTFERAVGYLSSTVGDDLLVVPPGGQTGRSVPTKITTACLILKSHSSFRPDFFVEKIDKWVIFPYEIRETVETLKKTMSASEIVSLGLPKKYVEPFYD